MRPSSSSAPASPRICTARSNISRAPPSSGSPGAPRPTEVEPGKVTPIAGAFKAWKATGYAEDPNPKANGLAKPQATILAKAKSASCSLKIGDETKDKQSYFVQAGTSPDVYLVAKWSVDRLLVKVADIKKTTVAKQ